MAETTRQNPTVYVNAVIMTICGPRGSMKVSNNFFDVAIVALVITLSVSIS